MSMRYVVFVWLLLGMPARADTLCTVVADADSGALLHQEGDCARRATPASTFKIALSLMGFDAHYLQNAHAPTLHYRPGDPDWGGSAWLEPTDATRWFQYSVVWFSQRITHALGETTVRRYVQAFDYGNADISGDPGKDNGLERSWISSSLQISPLEQIGFLRKLVNRQLPVSAHAFEMTERVALIAQEPGGWVMHGKTGTAFPHMADGRFDEARGYGWFVGWARKEGRTLVFARLLQDDRSHSTSAGARAREAVIAQWPALASALAR